MTNVKTPWDNINPLKQKFNRPSTSTAAKSSQNSAAAPNSAGGIQPSSTRGTQKPPPVVKKRRSIQWRDQSNRDVVEPRHASRLCDFKEIENRSVQTGTCLFKLQTLVVLYRRQTLIGQGKHTWARGSLRVDGLHKKLWDESRSTLTLAKLRQSTVKRI